MFTRSIVLFASPLSSMYPDASDNSQQDASYQIVQCRIAEQVRAALDNLVLSEKPFSYAAVRDQDRVSSLLDFRIFAQS